MKTRLLVALVGLAISFALPTFAQEQNAVNPQVREQIEAVLVKYNEAVNKRDAAAIAARFTLDATDVRRWEAAGVVSGEEAIEKRYTAEFAAGLTNYVSKLLQIYPIGSDICAITQWSVGTAKGYGVRIFVRDADDWKICKSYEDITSFR
jgi:ketosteroid isomerase-like protein